MELKTILETRFAAKSFDGKKIDEKKIDQLKELIRLSPSSFNIQPWKIKVVTDQKVKDQLMAASWGQPKVGNGSHIFVFCADTDVMGKIDQLIAMLVKNGAPKESLKGYEDMMKGALGPRSPEALKEWAQKQVYIALETGLIGAKSLGFDSCPMEGFDPAAYAKILSLPKNLVPTVVMPVGYTTEKATPKVRFATKDVFF